MAPPLLTLQDIYLTFGGTPLFEGAELTVSAGERLCVVGRNGSGKSTLLKIAAGMMESDSGRRFLQPGVTIRYLAQEPDFGDAKSVTEYVNSHLAPADDSHTGQQLLETLGLTGDEQPATLSGGETRRAALAAAMAPRPDILLLDEPTNHLDLPAIEWLEQALREFRGAIVMISHDQRFLENLSRTTLWVDRGTTRHLDQGFGSFLEWRDKVLEEEELERHKLDRRIVREEHWLRYGVTARRKRNQRRLKDLHSLRATRQSERSERQPAQVTMAAQTGQASGKLVLEAKNLSKAFDGRLIVADLTLRIQRGDRLAIVGANGTGKTTLVNLLTGALEADDGTLKFGANLELVTLEQSRSSLHPDSTLKEVLTEGRGDTVVLNGKARHVAAYMKDFLFKPEQAGTPVRRLSGGERGRLMLARALSRPSNIMVLDEPTNDLDLETLDVLEELLADYPGTLLLVSHDRSFIDRIVTSTLASEGEGQWLEYAGGYSDMQAQRGASSDAAPMRVKKSSRSRQPGRKEAGGGSKKLTFKDQHALDTLPGKIEALSEKIAALEVELSVPDFYTKDPGGFAKVGQSLEQVQQQLSEAEDQWLQLEMQREELQNGGR